MTDVLASRSFRDEARPEAIEAVHTHLDALWQDTPFVPEVDRMRLTTAVVETACNVLQHAVPESTFSVELGVDICVRETSLTAKVSAFGAADPAFGGTDPQMPDGEAESGRGLALIRALVTTVMFIRQDGTNTWELTLARGEGTRGAMTKEQP
jgi:serine/threonine-protein kinase RsbW